MRYLNHIKDNILSKLSIEEITAEEKQRRNIEFMRKVAPIGGIDFSHPRYVQTGTGYEACLYVYGYPKQVQSAWLRDFTNFSESVVSIDIGNINAAMVKENLMKSLDEQSSRMRSAKTEKEYRESKDVYRQLDTMYEEINQLNDVTKVISTRIYVPAKTIKELEEKIQNISEHLNHKYKAGIELNETKNEYTNLFLPYSQQQKNIYAKQGQPILSSVLAIGTPFHFNSLQDPHGSYFGKTETGGCIFLDTFYKTNKRMAYNFVIVGKSGSGKSTALKKIILERIIQGDKVRIFDVEGDFEKLTNYLGGKIIYLDGTGEHKVNMFHIFPDETIQTAYAKHITKLTTIYQYLKKEANENEIFVLKKLIHGLYKRYNIIDEEEKVIVDIEKIPANEFPRVSDFVEFIKTVICNEEYDLLEIRDEHIKYVYNIELVYDDICSTYKHIFDGYTSSDSLFDEPLVCYNMVSLRAMEDKVFDAQLFSAISSSWAEFIVTGKEQKELYEQKILPLENVKHSLLIIDESHISINANKTAAVNELSEMFRQGRKYFAGIGLASQRISDYLPDHADSKDLERIKALFGLTDYRFLMKQDESDVPKLKTIFGSSINPDKIEKIPEFTIGQCLLNISGDRTIQIEQIYVPKNELSMFAGGA